ncbi:MAG: hypothetical protein GY822_10420, partial [Deltaproteobacteria bacterium]|nr:hypothetical protein [Deltaproteobacteria bacterium]
MGDNAGECVDNPAESVDADGDGVGNFADNDDDGDGASDSDEIASGTDPLDPNDYNINDVNQTPIITSTAATSLEGDTATEDNPYTYAATATDVEDDLASIDLTWTLTNAPDGMEVGVNTGIVTWPPAEGVITSGEVTLTVSDSVAASATEVFTITVAAVNDEPIITSTAVTA